MVGNSLWVEGGARDGTIFRGNDDKVKEARRRKTDCQGFQTSHILSTPLFDIPSTLTLPASHPPTFPDLSSATFNRLTPVSHC